MRLPTYAKDAKLFWNARTCMSQIPVPLSKPDPVVDGWLFLLCLLLTLWSPANMFYQIGMNVRAAIVRPYDASQIASAGLFLIVFTGLAVFSVIAGIRLWTIKPKAVKFAQMYLRTFLCVHLGYLAFWLLLSRPHISLSLARMVELHLAVPMPFFVIWSSYLEHSKRVKITYGSE